MTDGYDDWIGQSRESTDHVTARLVEEYAVVLAGNKGPGKVPAGFHWCLSPEICGPDDLGRDGHPRTGLFLPKLPLPRRMWAGGAVIHHGPFAVGDEVKRRSTIRDVSFKHGRSGKLGFVSVHHLYTVDGQTRIEDRHDIVYREDSDPEAPPTKAPRGEDWDTVDDWRITPDATMLFRYSAVTFNGHRIHYDHPYATGVEGYPGLVVHGPLQACWMQNLAAKVLGRHPPQFEYRGLSPLTADDPVRIEAREVDTGFELRVRRERDGAVTMQGKATV